MLEQSPLHAASIDDLAGELRNRLADDPRAGLILIMSVVTPEESALRIFSQVSIRSEFALRTLLDTLGSIFDTKVVQEAKPSSAADSTNLN